MKKKIKDFFEGRSRYIEYRNIKAYTVISVHLFYIYLSQYLVHPLSLIITCSTIQRILTRTREALSRGIEFLQIFNSMKIKEHY